MWNLRKYIGLILSGIGIILSFSAFIVFFCVYHNYWAGIWTIFSGVFAATCFQLHYLHWKKEMANYYTADALFRLGDLGIISFWISLGFFVWYIFITIYWHIPMVPVNGSSTISAVWCFMTGKWAVTLFYLSKRYARLVLLSGYDPVPVISS